MLYKTVCVAAIGLFLFSGCNGAKVRQPVKILHDGTFVNSEATVELTSMFGDTPAFGITDAGASLDQYSDMQELYGDFGLVVSPNKDYTVRFTYGGSNNDNNAFLDGHYMLGLEKTFSIDDNLHVSMGPDIQTSKASDTGPRSFSITNEDIEDITITSRMVAYGAQAEGSMQLLSDNHKWGLVVRAGGFYRYAFLYTDNTGSGPQNYNFTMAGFTGKIGTKLFSSTECFLGLSQVYQLSGNDESVYDAYTLNIGAKYTFYLN